MDNEPIKPKRAPVLALILCFTPAVLVMAVFATAAAFDLSSKKSAGLLMAAVIAGLPCALTASVMLFRRKTGFAILGGILLLVLNLCISLFFGCLAVLSQANF